MFRLVVVLAFATAALAGCNPECIDRPDCKRFELTADGAVGVAYTCVANKCVQGSSGGLPPAADGGR